ncbi:MAG: hypothetical protein LQ346_008412 [Caloplaca aetnensis]|nr:MAG: hypothetical protein LQ346_008412 [Caloplaca aetnensis]
MSTGECLSSKQAHALFDILTSHVNLSEIEGLKDSKKIATFGPPLQPSSFDEKSSPLLRVLLESFILDLPGLRNVTPHFWTNSIRQLATALDDSNLSESYDKGSVGIRRTLSTAIASIVESVARGRLGGYPRRSTKDDAEYHTDNPDDILRAWDDFLQRIIYGDLLDKMFVKASETDKLSDHESVVQAAHQYAVIMLASLMHHNLIVSPRGQSMLSLLNRVHRLMPYFLVKQTLKVGNAASMLNGMVQLLLAKMNLSTLTSWFGAQPSDSGMNLLQQIISQVLSADTAELRKRAKAIEQSRDSLDKSQMDQFRKYASATAQEQDAIRKRSRTESISIVKAILAQGKASQSLTDSCHKLALEYVSLQLAIRDREKLIEVLCHHQPDLLTTSIRELVKVYDPIIRALHNAVDLASGVTDAQAFLDDMISLSLIDNSKKGKIPTVQDFVHLLQKHQGSSHVFIHQALKNGKELSQWYHEYARHAVEQYKQETHVELSAPHVAAAGDLTGFFNELVSKQSKNEQQLIIGELDRYANFLESLSAQSKARMQNIVHASLSSSNDNNSQVDGNPGMFLYKWQCFIDDTPITPGPEGGAPRTGESESVKEATAVDVDGRKPATLVYAKAEGNGKVKPPDVSNVLRLLEPGFEDELRRLVDVKKGLALQ